jgi:hypothetical protein
MNRANHPKWQEKAEQALRNPMLNESLLQSLPYPALIINRERIILAANGPAREMGSKVGTYCWDSFGQRASLSGQDREYFETHGTPPPGGIRCTFCLAGQALAGQSAKSVELPVGESVFETWWTPLDQDTYLHYAIDITEKKK